MKKENVMAVIAPYMGKHRYLIMAGRTLAAISALVALVPFYQVWKIIRIAIEGTQPERIVPVAWQALGITILSMIIYVGALMCTHIAAFRVQANMRTRLMERILKLPLGVFDREGTGKIRRIVMESTAATETHIAHTLPDKAVAAATPVGLLLLFLVFDWKLGLICFIPGIIGFLFMGSMMGKEMQQKMAEYQNALEHMSSEAVEYVRGIPVVKTFGQTINSFHHFKNAIDEYGKWTVAYTISLRKTMVAFMTAINATFAVIIAAAYAFSGDGVTPELILNVMYYIIITPLVTVTLTKTAYAGESEMTLLDSMKRVNNILSMKELIEPENAKKPVDCSVELQDVSYRYEGTEKDAVHNLSLSIHAGEHVAFVGPSGGGKTTTAELIARFFDVTKGRILIGGMDVKTISSEDLMKQVSFVFQDNKLLKTSIFENVRLAKPDASEADVMEALKRAQCMDIIEKLPKGIHTIIGERGTYVSGGEQQRIAIARAILKDAPILILDEATAFADPDNEVKVQNAFTELANGKTLIMIAHRLSTVVHSDRIFVLKDGTVVESGTHSELMNKGGLYHDMYQEYNKSVEWKVGA